MSWLIPKSALHCFSNESVEEYLSQSYKISNGRASSSDLNIKPSKLFLHSFLSHIMYAFSRRLGKYFKGRKEMVYHVLLQYPCQFKKNGQFSGTTFTLFLFYYFSIIKQIKLDCTLNA